MPCDMNAPRVDIFHLAQTRSCIGIVLARPNKQLVHAGVYTAKPKSAHPEDLANGAWARAGIEEVSISNTFLVSKRVLKDGTGLLN